MKQKCAKGAACVVGEVEQPLTEFRRASVHAAGGGRHQIYQRTCKACFRAALKAANDRWVAKLAAERALTIRCCACGRRKAATDRNFKRSQNGKFGGPCRECFSLRHHEYIQRPDQAARRATWARSERGKAAKKRYMKKAGDARNKVWREKNRARVNVHYKVARLVAKGKVSKQPCRSCGARSKPYLFVRDLGRWRETIEWYCRSCHRDAYYGRVSERVEAQREESLEAAKRSFAMKYGVDYEVADKLVVLKDEWEEVHQEHLAQLRREAAPEPWTDARLRAAGARVTLADLKASSFMHESFGGELDLDEWRRIAAEEAVRNLKPG